MSSSPRRSTIEHPNEDKDAPAPARKQSNGATDAAASIKQLRRGSVARIEPDEGQSIRELRVNLAEAAKQARVSLETWEVDGALYEATR